MVKRMELPKYSLGMGDRFAHQGQAQLRACILAAEAGVEIAPVWNKSNREHVIIGSEPRETRDAADAAVKALGWAGPYFVDADHINLNTFPRFVAPCDFFTIDVADNIGQKSDPTQIQEFIARHPELQGTVTIPQIAQPFQLDRAFVQRVATQFLAAVQHAGEIYRAIAERKGEGNCIAEISMDETDSPQTPPELLIILAAIADEHIPVQTIAPKFSGRFNKGVDYVGDVPQFGKEFREDLATIAYAVERYNLSKNLKLSVHSGSDKFSIYGSIREALQETGAGVHVKTAGTTWLEELIGLAEAGNDGLVLTKKIYAEAYTQASVLCAPYSTVIDIDHAKLPTPAEVAAWTGEQYVSALRHDPMNPAYNPSLRQLLHVGFKVAAKMGARFTDALDANREIVSRNVTQNLFARHIRPIFLGS